MPGKSGSSGNTTKDSGYPQSPPRPAEQRNSGGISWLFIMVQAYFIVNQLTSLFPVLFQEGIHGALSFNDMR